MPETANLPQALPDQIVTKMLETLQPCPEFDEALLRKLAQLADKGHLKKPARVADAIRALSEAEP